MKSSQYIQFLIATCNNYTCTNLSEHLAGAPGFSHDAVSDFLGRTKLKAGALWKLVKPLIDDGPDSYLIFDDSVQNKQYSKKIELVKLQYSGAKHGLVPGICIVNLVHTNGVDGDFYPIDYRIYAPENDGKTKNDHFREMYNNAIEYKKIKAKTILFDSWYASVDNLKLIHRSKRYFITTLKSNRKVTITKEQGYINLEDIEWTDEQLANGIIIKPKALPFFVRLFKIVVRDNDIEWVITNRGVKQDDSDEDPPCPITAEDARKQSAFRWQIEQMHRELKQLVGTEKCQCRKARSQKNHIACCYQAWLSLKIATKKVAGSTLYSIFKSIWSPHLKQQMIQPTVPVYRG